MHRIAAFIFFNPTNFTSLFIYLHKKKGLKNLFGFVGADEHETLVVSVVDTVVEVADISVPSCVVWRQKKDCLSIVAVQQNLLTPILHHLYREWLCYALLIRSVNFCFSAATVVWLLKICGFGRHFIDSLAGVKVANSSRGKLPG